MNYIFPFFFLCFAQFRGLSKSQATLFWRRRPTIIFSFCPLKLIISIRKKACPINSPEFEHAFIVFFSFESRTHIVFLFIMVVVARKR